MEKVNGSFDIDKIKTVAKTAYRDALLERLRMFDNDPKKAFTGKNTLDKNPLWLDNMHTQKVPEKVKTVGYETIYTIRKEISPDLKIDKVIDSRIRDILKERLAEHNGNSKVAFSNLDENPIWLKKGKGISIKRVKISGVNNAIALHDKHDKDGKLVLGVNGKKLPVDFVSTGNNHHVAIYRKPLFDKNGQQILNEKGEPQFELDERIVSFYEATSRAILGYPIVDRDYKKDKGWQFLFTMKQNEYFVFPRYDEEGNMVFNPKDYDEEWYLNPDNYAVISPNLFRVQKLTTKDYVFRHHLETTVEDNNILRNITWKRIQHPNYLSNIIKVRINHIGNIVSVGEY